MIMIMLNTIFARCDCVFLLHIYIKNIQLSTLASNVIKLIIIR